MPLSVGIAVVLEALASTLPTAIGLVRNPEWLPGLVREIPTTVLAVARLYGVCFLIASASSVLLRRWPVSAVLSGALISTVGRAIVIAFIYPATPFAQAAVKRVDPHIFLQPLLIGAIACSIAVAISRWGDEESSS